MDDSCAVCAEPLEWVAYGSCGHREVCSTCVSRLRFILDDRRCCICKNESPTVFVTKALGDYTRMINDFSVFPDNATEVQVGAGYWYHEDTQSYFDDVDHYKMIKAMCRLSCSVCDRCADEQGNGGLRRRDNKFKNIEQLKSHLYHRHRMFMCSLCLEGRKIFICEQKLYTRAQLNQHISTGDSGVDGSESERGGFMGHPMCEFCRNPFYGDNELYTHMSTEHFTCHICQRQHPGQYDYFKNYDDLEIHFRQEHFLCEDEACLTKKFIVFQSESEMKRHNAMEHGGHMSRSKRNAALQIPTSFRYRRSNENDQRRGRGRGFRLDSSDNQLSVAIQASFETASTDVPSRDSSSSAQVINHNELSEIDAAMGPFDSLTITSDSDPPSRYLQAVSQRSKNATLEESSFPPLPVAQKSSKQKSTHTAGGSGKNTMAARLRVRNKGTVRILNSSHTRLAENQGIVSSGSAQTRPVTNHDLSSSSAITAQTRPTLSSTAAISAQTRPKNSSSSAGSSLVSPATDHGLLPPSSATSPWSSSSSISKITHSVSAPNLVDRGSLNPSMSSTVPLSRTEDYPSLPTNSRSSPIMEDVQTANKSLVERIRAGLGHSEDKYAAFKDISAEFRQGQINTWEYLAYVQQFGLSHLVLELARLCPDAQKQRELIDAYNASLWSNGPQENGSVSSSTILKVSSGSIKGKGKSVEVSNGSSKGKGKSVDGAYSSAKDALADSIISTVRKLQENYRPSEEEVELLPKDGYRIAKGKSKVSLVEEPAELSLPESHPSGGGSNQNVGGGVSSKQRRKTSKFHRMRLGDASAAALLDLRNSDAAPEHVEETNNNPSEGGLPVSSVWKNGGGQKLVARTQRAFSK